MKEIVDTVSRLLRSQQGKTPARFGKAFVIRLDMSQSSINPESRTYHSPDGCARITVTPVQRVDHGVIIDMEVSLNPDTKEGVIPNKWNVSWINYAHVIEENFVPFVEKYCPEPEKVLTLFRELRMEHLSYQ